MQSLWNITCLPIIVALVTVIMAVYKHAVANCKPIWTKLIPMWALLLGAALGIYIFFKIPKLMIADNILSAMLIGMVSGLSAVGFNQIGKQFSKSDDAKPTDKKPSDDQVVK